MQCLPLARVAAGDIGHCQEHSILLAIFAAIMITSFMPGSLSTRLK
jgi:hypothetical protein